MTAPKRRTVLVRLIAAALSLSALAGCSEREVVVGRDAASRSKRNLKGGEDDGIKNPRGRAKQGG
jgi:hypothetical protein